MPAYFFEYVCAQFTSALMQMIYYNDSFFQFTGIIHPRRHNTMINHRYIICFIMPHEFIKMRYMHHQDTRISYYMFCIYRMLRWRIMFKIYTWQLSLFLAQNFILVNK